MSEPENADNSFAVIMSAPADESDGDNTTEGGETTTKQPGEDEASESTVPKLLDNEDDEDEDSEETGDDLLSDAPKDGESIDQWKARKEKGITKIVNRLKEREEALNQSAERLRGFTALEEALSDPQRAPAMVQRMVAQLAAYHNTTPQAILQGVTQGTPAQQEEAGSESKYGLRWSTDDLVVDKVKEIFGGDPDAVKKAIEYVNTAQQREAAAQKAGDSLPLLQSEFGDWVDTRHVEDAIRRHPEMSVSEAFAAVHYKEIAKRMAEYGATRAKRPDRDMIRGEGSATKQARKPGQPYSFEEALEDVS